MIDNSNYLIEKYNRENIISAKKSDRNMVRGFGYYGPLGGKSSRGRKYSILFRVFMMLTLIFLTLFILYVAIYE